MAHVELKPEEVAAQVPELRQKVKEKAAANPDRYDPRDLKRFEEEDAYTKLFLRGSARGDVEKALAVVDGSFTFRKEYKIHDLNADFFPPEFAQKNAIYYKGHDKDGHPILYVNVKENNVPSEQNFLLKQYIAWHFEQHATKNPEQMCVVFMDMSSASLSNISIDMSKFIITCFTTYFPTFLAYLVNYEMPFILSATWKIISAFLNPREKQKLLMLKKKDLKNHIPEAGTWWPHMQEK